MKRCDRCRRARGCKCCTFCRWIMVKKDASWRHFRCDGCGRTTLVLRNRSREIQFNPPRVQTHLLETEAASV